MMLKKKNYNLATFLRNKSAHFYYDGSHQTCSAVFSVHYSRLPSTCLYVPRRSRWFN